MEICPILLSSFFKIRNENNIAGFFTFRYHNECDVAISMGDARQLKSVLLKSQLNQLSPDHFHVFDLFNKHIIYSSHVETSFRTCIQTFLSEHMNLFKFQPLARIHSIPLRRLILVLYDINIYVAIEFPRSTAEGEADSFSSNLDQAFVVKIYNAGEKKVITEQQRK